jgi:hypothetical protein
MRSLLGRVGVGLAVTVLLMTGCTLTYRAGVYPIPPDMKVKEFQGKGEAISIKSAAIEGVVYIGTVNPYTYYTDIKQVTDVAISLFAEELSKRGFSIQKDAVKTITLNVTGVNITYTIGSYHCNMKIEYSTSDGYRRIFFPYNSSGLYNRACNGAITKGVAGLLNDERLIEFLRKQLEITHPAQE